MANNRVIGCDNKIPWHLPADLKRFKALTNGKPIVMGRRTLESLPCRLPDRHHIVITSACYCTEKGCTVAHSIDDALLIAGYAPEVMIIGGAAVYEQFLPVAQSIYLTLVHADVCGDTFFPGYDSALWIEIERESHQADEWNPHPYTFLTLKRLQQDEVKDEQEE